MQLLHRSIRSLILTMFFYLFFISKVFLPVLGLFATIVAALLVALAFHHVAPLVGLKC